MNEQLGRQALLVRFVWAVGLVCVAALMPARAEGVVHDVARSAVCVTNGTVGAERDGRFLIESPSSRAVVRTGDENYAGIVFEYLGPSESASALASGKVVQQLGIKLRAQDSCNVVYVMWGVGEGAGIDVVTKINQGKSEHKQCGVKGYTRLQPLYTRAVEPLVAGKPRRLEATIERRILAVTVDGQLVWRGDIGPKADALHGYPGIRTDNVRVRYRWLARDDEPQPAGAPARQRPRVVCNPVH